MNKLICANEECGKEFVSNKHNQKYCTKMCCKIATNRRIMKEYYKQKAQRSGALRFCLNCSSKLSRYNPADICQPCKSSSEVAANEAVVDMLQAASFVV